MSVDPAPKLPPNLARPGRGAASNAVSRYEPYARAPAPDGWDIEEDRKLLRTEVSEERPRSAITRNTSPDVGFDRSLNPYRGCEHGCIYCFARPTHAYLGLSPGLDFETRLLARPGIDKVLAGELRRKGYDVAPIALGTNTDPYQPVEARYRLMRAILNVLSAHRHPVTIVTKGTLIERDIDILAPMAAKGLVQVGLSLTTLDAGLSRKMEPRAPAPARRLATIGRLAAAGIPVRAMLAPVVPGLTDHEIEHLLGAAAGAGAKAASWIMLRLPQEVSPLFRDWLQEHFPGKFNKVMGKLRDMHGGRDYAADWGHRMRGAGPHAQLIGHRFTLAARRLGLAADLPALRRDLFAIPGQGRQLSLF